MQYLYTKYDKAVPRYTSYPALPNWEVNVPTQKEWISIINDTMSTSREISIYIHLPYCENLCTYCACNKHITKNHSVESSYVDAVIKEWNLYLNELSFKPVIKELHLGGGTPTFFSHGELDRLLKGIFAGAELVLNKNFAFEAHPSSTTIDHLTTLARHGFRRISIGVQDISEKVLKAINRIQTTEQIEYLTSEARRLGYESVNYDIIYGLPFQSIVDIEATANFVKKMKPDRLAFYSYAHVPWKSKGQRAFTEKDIAFGQEKLDLKLHAEKIFLSSAYKQVGMDHYALESDGLWQAKLNKTLHRNFMGYTEFHTNCLIGLGNSSISECGEMYVQNEKTINDYKSAVNQERIPIFKGHQLSVMENRLKQHIISIICHQKTSFNHDVNDREITQMAKSEIEDLVKDGLVRFDSGDLVVLPTGYPFIRNICAAIDPHFKKILQELTFSKSI